MIIGIGIDITAIERVSSVYGKFGLRFAKKILHPNELAKMPKRPQAFLASRFAAKEACVKALGTGFAFGIGPTQIEIAANEAGKPLLVLHGAALEKADNLGVAACHISLSHERQCAIAMVILED